VRKRTPSSSCSSVPKADTAPPFHVILLPHAVPVPTDGVAALCTPQVSTTALAACVKRLTLLSTSHAIFLKDFSMDLTGMMMPRLTQCPPSHAMPCPAPSDGEAHAAHCRHDALACDSRGAPHPDARGGRVHAAPARGVRHTTTHTLCTHFARFAALSTTLFALGRGTARALFSLWHGTTRTFFALWHGCARALFSL
jgi:hypothetical protein